MKLRLAILAVLSAALLVPALAQTSVPTTALTVRSCQVGDTPKQRQATFYARMRAIAGSDRMWMRFSLIDRAAADGPVAVDSPALRQWRKSRPGVRSFGYAQTIAGLPVGGVYAVEVQYRWYDADGTLIRSRKRTSGECRQSGKLPNLTIPGVSSKPGEVPGVTSYAVDVANRGDEEARGVRVEVFVDGATPDAAVLDVLKAGETRTVRFSGPPCTGRIRAMVDRLDTVHETTDDDNVLRARCPGAG